jgi:hypothetical protein
MEDIRFPEQLSIDLSKEKRPGGPLKRLLDGYNREAETDHLLAWFCDQKKKKKKKKKKKNQFFPVRHADFEKINRAPLKYLRDNGRGREFFSLRHRVQTGSGAHPAS